ncbi:DUF397 domain-containing protein [Streptomyces sp. NPDC050759]|uniref:DUF397 domain-containing protein n=1 Tax=Streptomyces sp. NPDC050759 TaxID=3365635 RepID=UPI00378C62F9
MRDSKNPTGPHLALGPTAWGTSCRTRRGQRAEKPRPHRTGASSAARYGRLRAITIRWTWFVPSYICVILASRIIRSTG